MAKYNDINPKEWKSYDDIKTDSLWIIDRRDKSGLHSNDYYGNFVPQIPYQLLMRYTKKRRSDIRSIYRWWNYCYRSVKT